MKTNCRKLWILPFLLFLTLTLTGKADEPYTKYLFAYFAGNSDAQENVFYAVADAATPYDFTPLNGGRQVIDADDISLTGGVRDPFLMRGEDGMFYMVLTDMKSANGWSSNRSIVMLKSADLIHWTSSTVHFPTKYVGTTYANVTYVWAPEIIYDSSVGKYLVHFAIGTSDGNIPYQQIYYAYANNDFTDLEGEPQHLFDRGSATIDMSIIYNSSDGLYHGFYKAENNDAGICHATASSLTGTWTEVATAVDQTTDAVEGCEISTLIDGTYVLMYDCYMLSPAQYEFCTSTDLNTFTAQSRCSNTDVFTPRHGSIIPITDAEYNALVASTDRDRLGKEIAIAQEMGVDVSAAQTVFNNTSASVSDITTAYQSLKGSEESAINAEYTNDVTSLLGAWTNSNVTTNSGQHWDGTSSSTYYEQPGDSWATQGWTMSMTQTVTLPAGDYVLKVAGRGSGAVDGYISVDNDKSYVPSNGDTGKGITTSGTTSYSSGTFANGNNGRGWEWTYLPFTVDSESGVNLKLFASTMGLHQWVSFTSIQLLSNTSVASAAQKEKLRLEIANATAEGLTVTGEQAVYDNASATIAEVDNTYANLKTREQTYQETYYQVDASSLLNPWTMDNVTYRTGQHWDGTTTSQYYEMNTGYGNASWNMSLTQTVSLPAGEYLLRVAARASAAVTATVTAAGTSVSVPQNGDVGYGIATNGDNTVSSSATYANNNLGRGWEWRYVAFRLNSTQNVTFTLAANATAIYNYVGFTSIQLLSKNEVSTTVTGDANTISSQTQVTSAVTISTAVDYKITGSTPFATAGSVNIAHRDAALILTGVKPSVVLASYMSKIKIFGGDAVNGANCQVKIYGDGTIILPHGDLYYPLTLYSGVNCTGESTSLFTVGEKISLESNSFNNNVRSFTLKRGYSVCFSTKTNITGGYSRIFVADQSDLKVNLPDEAPILDGTISWLRINRWNDTSKKGYAGAQSARNAALNTTWYYNWNDNGQLNSANREYVGIRQQPWWPNPDQESSNVLGYNEFDNSVEDSYKNLVSIAGSSDQDAIVNAAVGRWTDLLVTGKRIGSPCVSNFSNNFSGGMLEKFMNKLDERGYRCDYIVTHCYWYNDWSSWSSWLTDMYNLYQKPIWITEMNYGANWTSWASSDTGASTSNYNIELQHFGPIIDGLESTGFIERYAVYNDVQECRYMFYTSDSDGSDNTLTPMGEYYANKASNLAYDSRNRSTYFPKLGHAPAVTYYVPGDPVVTGASYNSNNGVVDIQWSDTYGEYVKTMYVERLVSSTWTVVYTETDIQENGGSYAQTISAASEGTYRIHTIDFQGGNHYSSEVTVTDVSGDHCGDCITYNGSTYYLGGNIITNGDFDFGTSGWGTGADLNVEPTYPAFEVHPIGGPDGGAYLQNYVGGGVGTANALRGVFDITANKPYYFSEYSRGGGWNYTSISSDGETESQYVLQDGNYSLWTKNSATFDSGTYTKFQVKYRWLVSNASAFDKLYLGQLFTTEALAYQDGITQLRKKVTMFASYNTAYSGLNTELNSVSSGLSGTNYKSNYTQLNNAFNAAMQGLKDAASVDSLLSVANNIVSYNLPHSADLSGAIAAGNSASTASEYAAAKEDLIEAINASLPSTDATGMVANPIFNGSYSGWTVKTGYQGGDQRLNTFCGKTCWNAWWSVSKSSADATTLGIRQTISNLPMGFYCMDCLATTQSYCLTDQHGFISAGGVTRNTAALSLDMAETVTVTNNDMWQRLSSSPVYVSDGELSIGFQSSKQGALADNASYKGSNREGWWCATDFHLYYTPACFRTVPSSGLGTVSLPFSIDNVSATYGGDLKVYELTGKSADGRSLVFSQVNVIQAGKGYLFRAEGASQLPFVGECGVDDVLEAPVTASADMQGVFSSSAGLVPNGAWILSNGNFYQVDNSASFNLGDYRSYIPESVFSSLPVVSDGGGIKSAIVVSDLTTTAIHSVGAERAGDDDIYTLTGIKVNEPQRGFYIKGGKKYIRK